MQHSTFTKPTYLSIRARLRQPNYANFLTYYHDKSAAPDYFYKYLTKLSNVHKQLVNQDTIFKSNFNDEGFYFKTKIGIKCVNAIKKPCLIEDVLDRDVTMKLKITPYNFTDNTGSQLIGISIQATHISC